MRSGKYYQGVKSNGRKQDYHRHIMEKHLGRSLLTAEVVHHINGDINDNRIENLAVMSLSEHSRLHMQNYQMSEETKAKLSSTFKGRPKRHLRRLSDADVFAIYRLAESGTSQRRIGKQYNIDHSTVQSILNGKTYKNCYDQYLAKKGT